MPLAYQFPSMSVMRLEKTRGEKAIAVQGLDYITMEPKFCFWHLCPASLARNVGMILTYVSAISHLNETGQRSGKGRSFFLYHIPFSPDGHYYTVLHTEFCSILLYVLVDFCFVFVFYITYLFIFQAFLRSPTEIIV